MPEQDHIGRFQPIRSFVGSEDNLRITGQLYVSATRAIQGWLLDSWSELGAPFWQARMHWFARGENKFYRPYFDFDRRTLTLVGEDKDIEPERANFLRKMADKWEQEWWKDGTK